MKLEYAVLLALACGAVPAMGGLGHGFDHAIAADARASAAPSAFTRSSALRVVVTSRQAAVIEPLHAVWEMLPKAFQTEVADVMAFKRYVAGANSELGIPARSGTADALAVTRHASLTSLYRFAAAPRFDRVMKHLGEMVDAGHDFRGAFEVGEPVRELLLDSAIRQKSDVLAGAPELPKGSARRGARIVMPELPETLWDHFFAWAKTQGSPLLTKSDIATERQLAGEMLLAKDFGGYMSVTRPYAGAVGAAQGSVPFGIALEDLPRVLQLWRDTPYQERSAAIRRSMDGNVSLMRDGLAATKARLAEHTALWGDAQANFPGDLKRRRATIVRAEKGLAAFEAKGEVSRKEALAMVYAYLTAESKAHRGQVRFRPFEGYSEGKDTKFVPVLSATDAYWGYEQVPAWRREGFYPLEIPLGLKVYDDVLGTPFGYAAHDHQHITDIVNGLRSMDIDDRALAAVEKHQEMLRGTDPQLSTQIDFLMGEAYWEPRHPLTAARNNRAALGEAATTLAGWLDDWATANGDKDLARRVSEFRKVR